MLTSENAKYVAWGLLSRLLDNADITNELRDNPRFAVYLVQLLVHCLRIQKSVEVSVDVVHRSVP